MFRQRVRRTGAGRANLATLVGPVDGPVDAGRRAPARGEPAWDVDAGDRRDSEPDWEGREMSDPSLSGCCSNMSQRISPPSHGQWFVLLVWPSLQDFRKLNKMYDMCEPPGLTRSPGPETSPGGPPLSIMIYRCHVLQSLCSAAARRWFSEFESLRVRARHPSHHEPDDQVTPE